MSRSRTFCRLLVAAAALFTALLFVAPAFAGTTPAPASPQAKADAVRTALQGIDGRLDRLEAGITRAEHVAPSPPRMFSHELKQLGWQIKDQTHHLIGLHWTIANPVLKEAGQLRNRIEDLRKRLDNWHPILPPDPDRPLKTSAATGTGAITGTLTDAGTGDPIPFTRVEVFCSSPYFDAETMSGAGGVYTMEGLGTGNCYVRTWNQRSYIDELFDNVPCRWFCPINDGTPVPVVDGQTTTGIDFALQLGGEIRGTVTDAEDGSPVDSLFVDLLDPFGVWLTSATPDPDGHYRLDDLEPGIPYLVFFDPNWSEYVPELYDSIPCPDSCDLWTGTLVAVSSGLITNGVDASLERTGSISGTVTDSSSGAPLSNADLAAYFPSGSRAGDGSSGSGGTYQVYGLAPGDYFLLTSHNTHATELYDDIPCLDGCDPTTGTPIQVAAGADTPGINISVDPLPAVSGTIVDAVSGAALENATVSFYSDIGNYKGTAYCDLLGQYSYGKLKPGTYYATASEPAHLTELYQENPCPFSCVPTGGTPITLTLGADVTGIDFTLDPEATIVGSVTSVAGDPLDSIFVRLFDSSGTFINSELTDYSGQFEIGQLPAGSYYAEASESSWVSQIYDGINCIDSCDPTTGTPIPTTTGGQTQISFSLTAFGSISGQVTETGSGNPVGDAMTALYTADGNHVRSVFASSDGTFQIDGLQTGSYRLVTLSNDHYDELYDNIPCEDGCDVTTGTPISVTIGAETTGIDVALNPMGSISGHVTDSLGERAVATAVSVYDSQGTEVGIDSADYGTGAYSVTGLLPGTYFVATTGTYNYLDELYDNIPCEDGCDVTTGTPVVVTDGVDTPNIDFALDPVQVFDDVPLGYWARYWIQALFSAGVTSGCATYPLRYCPEDPVARNQMAVFLLASKEGPYYTPPPAIGIFPDVPPSDPFAPWVEDLAARGITSGCGGGLFCPYAPVTRREMAVFLLATLEGPLYSPPPAVGLFDDVPAGDPFAPWIEELANRGITSGCSTDPPLYCPYAPVTRAQMAVFLVTMFGLY